MKIRENIKKLTEPLVYVVLVAGFGFITTVVNHTNREEQLREAEFVSLTIENELETLYYKDESGVSL